MTEETRKRLERIEKLLGQAREIDRELDELLNPASQDVRLPEVSPKKERPVIPTTHTFVEEALGAHPEGLTTREVFVKASAAHPEMKLTQFAITASLVYLTHKRGSTERIGQGRYRLSQG